jgi:hypothetical protein
METVTLDVNYIRCTLFAKDRVSKIRAFQGILLLRADSFHLYVNHLVCITERVCNPTNN